MEDAMLALIARVRLAAANAAELDLLDHVAEEFHAAWKRGEMGYDLYKDRIHQIDRRRCSLAFGADVYGLNAALHSEPTFTD